MLTLDNKQSRLSVFSMLRAQWCVLFALMLRDIKSRWGSSLGFLITAAWPLSHIMILVAIYIAIGRVAPYGDSAVLWFSISMVPFMIFSYVSRFIIYGLVMNKALLVFPVIKVTDILFSRMIIELVNTTLVVICLIIILWYLNVDFIPFDLKNAAFALAAAVLLGLGAGIINSLISAIFPMWVTGYMLSIIVMWMTSGVLFVPNAMPEYLRNLLYYQPCIHLVEWMREAYYPEYNSIVLDKSYVLAVSLLSIASGLLVERIARGRIVLS